MSLRVISMRERQRRSADDLLQKIVSEHEPALRRFLRARLSGHADFEDLVQDTFVRIARMDNLREKLSQGEAQTRSYLFSIASNLIKDRHRRWKVSVVSVDAEDADSDQTQLEASAEEVVAWRQELASLKRAILKLDRNCREAFVLSRIHGKSYREIAESMNISVSMVEKHIMRALVAIRRRVDLG